MVVLGDHAPSSEQPIISVGRIEQEHGNSFHSGTFAGWLKVGLSKLAQRDGFVD